MSSIQDQRGSTRPPHIEINSIDQVNKLRTADEIARYVDLSLKNFCHIKEVFLILADKLLSLPYKNSLSILNKIHTLKKRSQALRNSSENVQIDRAIVKTRNCINQTQNIEINLIGYLDFYSKTIYSMNSKYQTLFSQEKQVMNTLSTLKQERIVATMEHFASEIDHTTLLVHAYLKKQHAKEMQKRWHNMQNSIKRMDPFNRIVLGGRLLNDEQIERVL
ncbi:MAG: hypothetical protein AAGI90_02610 [Chlamydiota bacterium]